MPITAQTSPLEPSRRRFLLEAGGGFGAVALAAMLADERRAFAASNAAAPTADLRRRGLWDDTLVIWGGEFGRMPMSEQGKGRDHNPWGYSVWLAGGAVKGGLAHGTTDDFGLRAAEHPVHVHDLHATILHILGLDHERLTYFHEGRDQRLTDVEGQVVRDILS